MKKALLLIDMQNDYFPNGNMTLVGAVEAAQNAKLILDLFRNQQQLIVHIQHHSVRAGATFFVPNTTGVAIYESLKPLGSECVFVKNYPNSFVGTGLLEYLKSSGVTHLVVAGMMTHMCVDATVRAAKDLGFEVTLLADACATKDLQVLGRNTLAADVHHAFLAALSYYYAHVVTVSEYLSVDNP